MVSKMNDDTISRQAAVYAVDEMSYAFGVKTNAHLALIKALAKLPSAERHGRWIKKYRGNYLCSVCGAWYRTKDDYGNIIDGEMTANYCEPCGSKMSEDEE